MLGWDLFELVLLGLLAPLLLASGFFSGSETALFGLSQNERLALTRRPTITARALRALLSDARMLLITILLGNMSINVLYFVISSVLMMRAETTVAVELALALGSLLLIVLLGEVMPKMIANSRRPAFCRLVAPPLLTVHRAIGPLRIGLERLVVAPLSRLTAPATAPPELQAEELAALLEISSRRGDIDLDEQRTLRDVLKLGRLKVRDVMTPRTRMVAAPHDASRATIISLVRGRHLTKLPVYRGSVDQMIGLLHVKRYLVDPRGEGTPLVEMLSDVPYVPAVATLVHLLRHFQRTGQPVAIVVDEFGGTAGVVTLGDLVEELVGEVGVVDPVEQAAPQKLDAGRWRVSGASAAHEWLDTFGGGDDAPHVATLGGLIIARLGRMPQVGDRVDLGNVHLDVEAVDGPRITSVLVTLTGGDGGAPDDDGGEPVA